MGKNVPDRIKLILQLIVFSLALWLPILFVLALITQKQPLEKQSPSITLIWSALALSVLSQLVRCVYHWRKILQQEKAGNVPDSQLPENLDALQTVLLLPGLLFMLLGLVVFIDISKPWGVACFFCVGILWFVDRSYFQKKKKHLN